MRSQAEALISQMQTTWRRSSFRSCACVNSGMICPDFLESVKAATEVVEVAMDLIRSCVAIPEVRPGWSNLTVAH